MYNSSKYKSLIIAFVATIIRYYNYAIFGLSASILSANLMPGDEKQKMLFFFLIFSLANFARPVGALIFGIIGDHYGRTKSIKIAAAVSVISSILIASTPNYQIFGIGSVLVLMLSRMLFLLSLSGEADAIKIFVAEISDNRKYLAISIVTCCSQIGVILASLMYHYSVSLQSLEWLWRINFLLGGVMSLTVIVLRNHFHESEMFLSAKKQNQVRIPTWQLIASNRYRFLLSTIIHGFIGSGYHFLIIFFGSFMFYTAKLISAEQASWHNVTLIGLYLISSPIAGIASEYYRNIKQPIIMLLISSIIVVYLLSSNFANTLWIHRILIIFVPFYSVPCMIISQSLFATAARMRMYSLSHSVGSMLFSATTPAICMLIWSWTDSVGFVVGYLLLTLLCIVGALWGVARLKDS